MAYTTKLQVKRSYLPQLLETTEHDGAIEYYIDVASAVIDLTTQTTFPTAAAGTQVVYGDGTDYLVPPAFVAGSVTAVTAPSGYDVPSYVERNGVLVVTRSGLTGRAYSGPPSLTYWYPYSGWQDGVPYTIAATFGYSTNVLSVVEHCACEIAVRLWRFKDAGGSEVIGADAAAVQVKQQFSPLVQQMLAALEGQQTTGKVGIW